MSKQIACFLLTILLLVINSCQKMPVEPIESNFCDNAPSPIQNLPQVEYQLNAGEFNYFFDFDSKEMNGYIYSIGLSYGEENLNSNSLVANFGTADIIRESNHSIAKYDAFGNLAWATPISVSFAIGGFDVVPENDIFAVSTWYNSKVGFRIYSNSGQTLFDYQFSNPDSIIVLGAIPIKYIQKTSDNLEFILAYSYNINTSGSGADTIYHEFKKIHYNLTNKEVNYEKSSTLSQTLYYQIDEIIGLNSSEPSLLVKATGPFETEILFCDTSTFALQNSLNLGHNYFVTECILMDNELYTCGYEGNTHWAFFSAPIAQIKKYTLGAGYSLSLLKNIHFLFDMYAFRGFYPYSFYKDMIIGDDGNLYGIVQLVYDDNDPNSFANEYVTSVFQRMDASLSYQSEELVNCKYQFSSLLTLSMINSKVCGLGMVIQTSENNSAVNGANSIFAVY